MALCIGAQAGRFLKSSEEIEYNHQEHSADIYASLKNYTASLHNYTVEVPEVVVSLYNHTWNKTNAYLEELSGHVSSLFNHSSEGEATTYNYSDIHQALFNYTKPAHDAAEEGKKFELPTFTLPTFNHSIELPKFNHTGANLTFVLPSFNHSDLLAEATEEHAAFAEKHG